jgi:hypothetical protein
MYCQDQKIKTLTVSVEVLQRDVIPFHKVGWGRTEKCNHVRQLMFHRRFIFGVSDLEHIVALEQVPYLQILIKIATMPANEGPTLTITPMFQMSTLWSHGILKRTSGALYWMGWISPVWVLSLDRASPKSVRTGRPGLVVLSKFLDS